ncbi:unnamed protein product [Rhizophagus irregularis]|nr:unnamed protein product [Rhizophagus irregularis]
MRWKTHCKEQKDTGRKEVERQNIGWMHDILLRIRINNVDYQVAFGEVVGNAFIQDEAKKMNDLAKLLKDYLSSPFQQINKL